MMRIYLIATLICCFIGVMGWSSATITTAQEPEVTETPTATATQIPQLTVIGTLDMKQFIRTDNGWLSATPTPLPWRPTPLPRTVTITTTEGVFVPPVLSPTVAITTTFPITADHLWFGRAFTDRGAWGSFSYPYGTNSKGNYLWHYGIDIAASFGNTIQAMGDGVVVHAGPDDVAHQLGPWPDFYGKAVVIQHADWDGQPTFTLYGHASETLVEVGQPVKAGDPIAKVGSGGVATGAHLHVETRLGANLYREARNPDIWIRPDVGFGVIIGRVMDGGGYFAPVQLVKLRGPEVAEGKKRYRREVYSYPNNVMKSDDLYQENFAFADVPVGTYTLEVTVDGHTITMPVTVTNQGATFVAVQVPPTVVKQ